MTDEPQELPAGWVEAFSTSQKRKYYFNEETKQSVWSLEDINISKEELTKRQRYTEKHLTESTQASETKTEGQGVENKKGISLAIIVPFRDLHKDQRRAEHLKKFIPHMEQFLAKIQDVRYFHVFIVEQSDDGRKFNRGKLLNVGFKVVRKFEEDNANSTVIQRFDSYVFHDVDLLPVGVDIASYYAKYPREPVHIARCWDRYNDDNKYFGGILSFNRQDFELIDGFPNTFWGWGGEDGELYARVMHQQLKVIAPPKSMKDSIYDLENMALDEKLRFLRQNKQWKCLQKWETSDELKEIRSNDLTKPPWWGLTNLFYIELGRQTLSQHTTQVTVDIGDNINEDGSVHTVKTKYT